MELKVFVPVISNPESLQVKLMVNGFDASYIFSQRSTAISKDFVDVWIRLDTPLPLDASRRPEVQIVADVGPHEKDICDLIEVWTRGAFVWERTASLWLYTDVKDRNIHYWPASWHPIRDCTPALCGVGSGTILDCIDVTGPPEEGHE